MQLSPGRNQTHNQLIASPTPYRYATSRQEYIYITYLYGQPQKVFFILGFSNDSGDSVYLQTAESKANSTHNVEVNSELVFHVRPTALQLHTSDCIVCRAQFNHVQTVYLQSSSQTVRSHDLHAATFLQNSYKVPASPKTFPVQQSNCIIYQPALALQRVFPNVGNSNAQWLNTNYCTANGKHSDKNQTNPYAQW